MTGAMYAAIAGLKTHMQNLNIIGNNIANVNTYGYKASRAVFKTSLYTTLNGGSNGTTSMGGTNPSQIGYGSTVSSVDVDMGSGNYAVTGKNTDLMLDGDGFFLVGSKDIAKNFDGTYKDVNRLTALTLTRVGNFEFRADGYLAKEDGNCVYGFLCIGLVDETNIDTYRPMGMEIGDPIFSDQLVPIRYPRMMAAHYYQLDENDPSGTGYVTEEVMVDDGNGGTEPIRVKKDFSIDEAYDPLTGELNEGFVTEGFRIAYPEERADLNGYVYDAGYSDALKNSVLKQARFTGISVDPNTGIITATSDDTKEVVTIGCIAIGKVTNPNGVTNIGDNYYKASAGSGELTIGISGGNAAAMGISQVNRSLQRLDANDPNATYQTIDGLTAYGTETHIISNGLEMSKTDLAQEISMMILTQRGYQANTRIITVTDSMLEELVNMKR